MSEEQETLLKRATQGDAGAVSLLLEQYVPQLRAFVRLRMDESLRRRESSSDLVQSICHDLLARQEDFVYQGDAQFRGWLFTAALNKIRERQRFHGRDRRDVRREVAFSSGESSVARLSQVYLTLSTPSRNVMAEEHMALVEAAFDELPEHYREVISLARIVGLPHEEIAKRMGRSVGAVRQLLGRGLVRLTEILNRRKRDS